MIGLMSRPFRDWDLRPIWIGIAAMIVVATVAETIALYRIIDDQSAVGGDLEYYKGIARRWLDTGVWYTDRQLSGPYEVQTQVDNLYPPHALYLFIPFLVLPAPLWWILPLSLVAYVVWWCRPSIWAWPILALLLFFPKSPNLIVYGNSDMWVAAAAAAGVRWGWPAVLVSFKPSVALFGVLGIRTRWWWIAAAVLALASVPLLALWLDYPTVMTNSSAKFWYSSGDLPFLAIPVVAWLVSARRGGTSVRSWVIKLLGGDRPQVRRPPAVG